MATTVARAPDPRVAELEARLALEYARNRREHVVYSRGDRMLLRALQQVRAEARKLENELQRRIARGDHRHRSGFGRDLVAASLELLEATIAAGLAPEPKTTAVVADMARHAIADWKATDRHRVRSLVDANREAFELQRPERDARDARIVEARRAGDSRDEIMRREGVSRPEYYRSLERSRGRSLTPIRGETRGFA